MRTGAPAAAGSAAARALPDCPRARATLTRPPARRRQGDREGGRRAQRPAPPRPGHAHGQPPVTPLSLRRGPGRFTAVRGNRAAAVAATCDEAAGETQGDTGGDTVPDGATWCHMVPVRSRRWALCLGVTPAAAVGGRCWPASGPEASSLHFNGKKG